MTPKESLQELRKIDSVRMEQWTFPLRLGPGDALAAELIEIAIDRLGEDAKGYELLNVAASVFWWSQVILSLGEMTKDDFIHAG